MARHRSTSDFGAKGAVDCLMEKPGSTPDDRALPRDLKVKLKEQRLLIDWKDGTRSELSLAALRKVCPCATCRTERSTRDENPLKILKSDPTDVRVTSAQLVGRYAIQFFWSDGHSTGIFEFGFLRSLDRS